MARDLKECLVKWNVRTLKWELLTREICTREREREFWVKHCCTASKLISISIWSTHNEVEITEPCSLLANFLQYLSRINIESRHHFKAVFKLATYNVSLCLKEECWSDSWSETFQDPVFYFYFFLNGQASLWNSSKFHGDICSLKFWLFTFSILQNVLYKTHL